MKILEKGKIGTLELKNRIFMAPMGTVKDIDHGISQRTIDFYVERAKGGTGLIFTSAHMVSTKYETKAGGVFDSPAYVERMNMLANELHYNGAKLCLQLSPGLGRMGMFNRSTANYAPSEIPSFWFPDLICKPYEKEMIEDLVMQMGYAAALAVSAGVDMIEIHAYGGYLFDQFQSSLWNKRTDEYGGDLKGRMKFTLDSIAEIRKTIGKKFPLAVKFTPYHGIEGGRELSEGLEMAKMFEAAGADCLHVDMGCYERWFDAITTVYQGEATQVHLAQAVKEAVKIPVLTQGKLGNPLTAEKVLEEGKADYIGLGHTSICEPNWANKVKNSLFQDIRPCIGCNECLYGSFQGKGAHCAINPHAGYEKRYPVIEMKEKKKILVVGAGPGGIQAALTAAERGMQVELWEKQYELGGNLISAGAPIFKQDVKDYINYITRQITKSNVIVRLGKEATTEEIFRNNFDAVIFGAGSNPAVPPIPGVDSKIVTTSTRVLGGKEQIGQNVVVIGGGLVGCEIGLHLKMQGKDVTIVEFLPDILMTVKHSKNNDQILRLMMKDNNLKVICGAAVKSIGHDYLTYEKEGKEDKIMCDSVVLATGYKSNNQTAKELEEKGMNVSIIGDSVFPRKIFDAVHEGFHATRMLFVND